MRVLRVEKGVASSQPSRRLRGGACRSAAPRSDGDVPVRRPRGFRRTRGNSPESSRARAPPRARACISSSGIYLDTPEGVAGDPGGGVSADVAEVPEPVAYSVQQLLVSLPRTAIYALLAAAYALVFGLVGRINLAFGELAAVGAAATVAGASMTLAIGVTAPLLGLAAGLSPRAVRRRSAQRGRWALHHRPHRGASPQPSLIATVGLSLVLMEYLRLAQSPVTVWLPPIWSEAWPLTRAGDFLVSLTPISLVTAGIGLFAGRALPPLAHARHGLRSRLAGLCGRRRRREPLRGRRPPPPPSYARARRRHGRPVGHADRRAIWRARVRRRVPVRAQSLDRGRSSAESARSRARFSAASRSGCSRPFGRPICRSRPAT